MVNLINAHSICQNIITLHTYFKQITFALIYLLPFEDYYLKAKRRTHLDNLLFSMISLCTYLRRRQLLTEKLITNQVIKVYLLTHELCVVTPRTSENASINSFFKLKSSSVNVTTVVSSLNMTDIL